MEELHDSSFYYQYYFANFRQSANWNRQATDQKFPRSTISGKVGRRWKAREIQMMGDRRVKNLKISQGTLKGKYHSTVDLLFDWFRNVHLCWVHWILYFTDAHFLTGQTGGQLYSDTSP